MRDPCWLLLAIGIFVTALSPVSGALAQESASPPTALAQLKFEPLVDGLCYVARFKVNVPNTYELIYKYNLTLAQAEGLPGDVLTRCGLPPRPAYKMDVDGEVSQGYTLWRKFLMVRLHPKNADKLLDPNIVKIDPRWRTHPPQQNSYLLPDHTQASILRKASFETAGGGATCSSLADAFPSAKIWIDTQAGRDLVTPVSQDTISAGSATAVQATIVVPQITLPKLLSFNNTSHASTWVGLTGLYPGNGNKYLAQAGVAIDLT